MATAVCFSVIADEPSRFVVGTHSAGTSLRRLIGGFGKVDHSTELIEAWNFDTDAGVLRVLPAPGSAQPERQFPLASLVNLSWGAAQETTSLDESSTYEVRLFFDDNNRPTFLHLPSSVEHLCDFSKQARTMERRLRTFLKPHCPRLESTTFEELLKFWRNPVEGLGSIQSRVQKRLEVLDNLSQTSQSASQPNLDTTPDPTASARELLTQLHSALGQLGQAAADRQRQRAESGDHSALGYARFIFFLLIVGLAFALGSSLLWK